MKTVTKKNSKLKIKNKKAQVYTGTIIPTKFGEKAADAVTKGAGSWTFIIGFIIFLLLWMAANIYAWTAEWDPYPFILLNLVLSCIAALQAPIILMSQNRSSEKDRQRAKYDYAVNRKAEREIQELKEMVSKIYRKVSK